MRPTSPRLLLTSAAFCLLAACGDSDADPTAPDVVDSGDTSDAGADADADAIDDVEPDADGLSDTSDDVVDATDAPEPPPSVLDFDVREPGPFRTGYRVLETTYADPSTGTDRTIPVHVWYPTNDTEGPAAPYLGGLFPDEDAFVDAEAAPPVDGVAYPTIVYSHGHQGFAGTSGFLMRAFASHGWVAIAPDHIGDLLTNSTTSGTLAHYAQRPRDITAALDAVEALPAEDPLAAARVEQSVVVGHSRGCTTVWATLGATFDLDNLASSWPDEIEATRALFQGGFRDDRLVAGVLLACSLRAGLYGDTGYRSIDVPVLAMTGSNDGPEGAQEQWDLMVELTFTWVELAGGCHQTFALGACDTLDVDLGFRIVSTWVRAFARRHLLSDDGATTTAILDGSEPTSATATVHVRTP